MVSATYKTISNINMAFSNCLEMRYIFAIFFTMDDVMVGKVTISVKLKKIHFPKISEQAPDGSCSW